MKALSFYFFICFYLLFCPICIVALQAQDPAQEKTFDVPPGICYNNQAHPAGPLRPAGNIWSITQEVEEVALERVRSSQNRLFCDRRRNDAFWVFGKHLQKSFFPAFFPSSKSLLEPRGNGLFRHIPSKFRPKSGMDF